MSDENLNEEKENLEELQAKLDAAEAELEAMKGETGILEEYGGIEKAHEILNTIANDKGVIEYMKNRNAPEEPNEAIEKVREIAREEMAPVQETLSTQAFDNQLARLSQVYPGWEQYTDAISKMAESFPFKDITNPSEVEMDTLVNMAARSVDGDAAIEVLTNEPVSEETGPAEIPKNLSTRQALDMALEETGFNFEG